MDIGYTVSLRSAWVARDPASSGNKTKTTKSKTKQSISGRRDGGMREGEKRGGREGWMECEIGRKGRREEGWGNGERERERGRDKSCRRWFSG